MDPITLALVGVFAAWSLRPESLTPKVAATVGLLAGLAPDVDVLLWPISGVGAYFLERGGVTHAVWMLPLWAALAAALVRWRTEAAFGALFRCGLAASLAHVVLELLSIQGVAPLAPVVDEFWRFPLVHTVDALVLLALSIPLWLPALRRRSYTVRGRAGLAAVSAALVVGLVSQLAASSYGDALKEVNGHEATASVHVFPQPWLTTRRSIAVVDAGLAFHAAYDLLSPPDTFREVVPLNDRDPSVELMGASTHVQGMANRGGLLYAEVRRVSGTRYRHLFIGDFSYFVPGGDNLAPRFYTLVRRTREGGEALTARWAWRDNALATPPPPKKRKKPAARPQVKPQ